MDYSRKKLMITSEGNEDRINSLPDHVLSHILSFLPTKYAVLTSVLSSRWRHLWTSIDNLHFDNLHFLNKENFNKYYGDEIFDDFVSRVMDYYSSKNIHKFRLACSQRQKISMSHLHDWVRTVADRNIEKLEIEVSLSHGLVLPNNVFTCKSLVSLTLKLSSAFDVPDLSNCFPSLKFFSISVDCPSAELANKLFSSCPVLEDLLIDCGCRREKEYLTFNITAPRLKTLKIEFHDRVTDDKPKNELVLNAPLLEYIHIQDRSLAGCFKDPVSPLEKAILDLGDYDFVHMRSFDERLRLRGAHMLLRAVANTKFLVLSFQTTMVLHHGRRYRIPCFPNLTTLKLEIYAFMVAKMLPKFLQESPNLKVIILDVEQHDEDDEANYERPFKWMRSSAPALCFQHLQVVKILSFSERPVEWHIIAYFLESVKMLQKVIVRAEQMKRSQKQRISDRMLKLPRVSEACVIKVL